MSQERKRTARRVGANGPKFPPLSPDARPRAGHSALTTKHHPPSSHDFRPTLALAKALNVTK
ncbi:hypothetical protein DB811_24305 [Xanthomonas perforans]|nr:hypothetical protein DB811_24305 [Xanthomonas perforans]